MKEERNLLSSIGYPAALFQDGRSLASAQAHLELARLSARRARTHRVLLSLREHEARIHAYLYAICRKSAADREALRKSPSRILRRFCRAHLEQQLLARRAGWAHREIAAHSVANAFWHLTCTNVLRGQIRN